MKTYTAKALKTREKILHAANDLFYEKGYNATGVEDVLASAGVSKGNFYYHFESKEDLAVATLEWHRLQAYEELGVNDLASYGSPLAALFAIVENMFHRMCESKGRKSVLRGCFFGNFSLEMSNLSEPVRKKVDAIFREIRENLILLLEEAKKAGEISGKIDSDLTASMILGLMEGSVILGKAARNREEVEKSLRFIRDFLQAPH